MGIPIALTRILDPLVWQELKKALCCMKKGKIISKQQDSLCSFVRSKMNAELVYITLVSISEFYNDFYVAESTYSSLLVINNRL